MRATQQAFSLIELLVVLAILGLALAVVGPAISQSLKPNLNDSAKELVFALRQARSDAVVKQVSVAVWVDPKNKTFLDQRYKVKQIPAVFQVQAQVAQQEVQRNQAGIRFYPDGSSSGGSFTLAQDDWKIRIEADWLTGKVQMKDSTREAL